MKKFLLVLIAVVSGFAALFAEARYYAWTYHFATMQPGEMEGEVYIRLTQPEISDGSGAKWLRQAELEVGITDRLDVAAYVVDSVGPGSLSVNFKEIKLRARYKLADKPGDLPVDSIIYAEYIINADRADFDEVEFKAIFAKDFGDFNASVNIVAEVSNKNWFDSENWGTGYSAGISYALFGGSFRLGAEAKGNWQSGSHLAGPSISIEAGRIWVSASPLFSFGGRGDDVTAQVITGIMF